LRIDFARPGPARTVAAVGIALHAPPIPPSNLEQPMRDLPEQADMHCVRQYREDVLAPDHDTLQPLELRLLLLVGGADELDMLGGRVTPLGSALDLHKLETARLAGRSVRAGAPRGTDHLVGIDVAALRAAGPSPGAALAARST
jgi:hypothetical protein